MVISRFVPKAAGRSWGRLEEARPCHCRLLGACGQESQPTSSCMLLVLYMSNLAQIETTMSQLYGKTSWQVGALCHCIHRALSLPFESFSYEFCVLVSFMFWQTKLITSGNRQQTISTVHMTTTLSCIMEGEWSFRQHHYWFSMFSWGVTIPYASCIFYPDMPSLKMADQQSSPDLILMFPLASETDPVI